MRRGPTLTRARCTPITWPRLPAQDGRFGSGAPGSISMVADGIAEVQAPRTLWAQGNSVYELPDGDILASYRPTSTVIRISRKTEKIIWKLGPAHGCRTAWANAARERQRSEERRVGKEWRYQGSRA